jgi:hypothetical protein
VGGTASATAFSGPLTGNVTGNLTGNVSAGAGTIATTNFTFTEVGGVLFLKNGLTDILKIDASGNLTALADVVAHGTI